MGTDSFNTRFSWGAFSVGCVAVAVLVSSVYTGETAKTAVVEPPPPTPRPHSAAPGAACERRVEIWSSLEGDPLGLRALKTYFYDEAGNLVRREEDDLDVPTPDRSNLRLRVTGEPEQVVTGAYDESGRLVRKQKRGSVHRFRYDNRGRLAVAEKWKYEEVGTPMGTGVKWEGPIPEATYRIQYEYDEDDNLAHKRIDFFAFDGDHYNVVEYGYDSDGNRTSLEKFIHTEEGVWELFPGFEQSIPDSRPADIAYVRKRTQTFDAADRRTRKREYFGLEPDADKYWEWRYAYTEQGKLRRIERYGYAVAEWGSGHACGNCDAKRRVPATEKPEVVTRFGYDDRGRRVYRERERVRIAGGPHVDGWRGEIDSWSYDEEGRLVQKVRIDGDQTIWKFKRYEYDESGRLTRIRRYNGGYPPPVGNGELQREKRIEYRGCEGQRTFPTEIEP